MKPSHDDNSSDDLSNSFTTNNDNDSPDIDDEDSINEVCGGRMGTKCRLKWFLPFVVFLILFEIVCMDIVVVL